jgi:hypothetical protein
VELGTGAEHPGVQGEEESSSWFRHVFDSVRPSDQLVQEDDGTRAVSHPRLFVVHRRPRSANMAPVKGDRVEIVVELGGGETRTYEIVATRAGRRVETTTGRGVVEVAEVTRTGEVVRTARFMQSRVIAVVEHPSDDGAAPSERPAPADQPGLGLGY